MSKILNPLVVARLRKYWYNEEYNRGIKLAVLLYEMEGWIHILGSGPDISKCDNCSRNLDLGWRLCKFCSYATAICWECYQCGHCEDAERSEGCGECGASCGAYMCRDCKRIDQ